MYHLRLVSSKDDPWASLIKDDPVRPDIPIDMRINDHAEILISVNEQDDAVAAVCIRYCNDIPASVDELLTDLGGDTVAVFYTIWSYQNGAGGQLIFNARRHIEKTRPNIKRFVTLSPLTEMARKFHLKNGASIFRENTSTVNYEYV